MASDRLVVNDERTGKSYVLPIEHGAVRATDLGQIKASSDDNGLTVYDPGLLYTAVCTSKVTYIDATDSRTLTVRVELDNTMLRLYDRSAATIIINPGQ